MINGSLIEDIDLDDIAGDLMDTFVAFEAQD